MHSKEKKVLYLSTLIFFSGCALNHTYLFYLAFNILRQSVNITSNHTFPGQA